MFKNLKKWAAVSLTAVMLCTMMAPQVAFAEEVKGKEVVDVAETSEGEEVVDTVQTVETVELEEEPQEESVETSVKITGLAEKATAGESGTFKVKVTGNAADLEGCYLEIHDGSGYCKISVDSENVKYDEYGAVVTELANGQELEVTYILPEWMHGTVYMDAILYDAENNELVYEEQSIECAGLVAANLSFAPTTTVTAGVAYPYSATITNQSDQVLENVAVQVYSSWHLRPWSAIVTGDVQDGVSFSDGYFTISTLQPHASITLTGTITFPETAVGERTHVMAVVYLNGDLENDAAYASSEDDTNYRFAVVGSGNSTSKDDTNTENSGNGDEEVKTSENVKAKAAKTGDTAQTAELMILMVMALAMIVAIRRREVK